MPAASLAAGGAAAVAEPPPAADTVVTSPFAVSAGAPPPASSAFEKTIVSPRPEAPAPAPGYPAVFVEEEPDPEAKEKAAKVKKIKIIAAVAVVVLGLAAAVYFAATYVPDITVEQARAIADAGRDEFCAEEPGFVCTDFVFEAIDVPAHKEFLWAFPFVNKKSSPLQKIIVDVTRKGKSSVHFEGPFPGPGEHGPQEGSHAGEGGPKNE